MPAHPDHTDPSAAEGQKSGLSRLANGARAGDGDLLVHTAEPVDALEQSRLEMKLEGAVHLPVDLLFVGEGLETTHFKRMICAQAQPLAA
jgi:predicted nucleotidyltransferase